MGETIKQLGQIKLSDRGIFPRRLVTECCENFHIHYRWLRIEMEQPEFQSLLSMFMNVNKKYLELNSPQCCDHEELGKELLPNLIDREIKIELCRNLYIPHCNSGGKDSEFFDDPTFIHIHWDNVRLEMSVNEFLSVCELFSNAKKILETSVPKKLPDVFESIKDLNYVVLRNYELLPHSVELGEHSDLDLLIREKDREELIRRLKLEKVQPNDLSRVQYKLNIIDNEGRLNFIYVDVRTDKDNYFPSKLSDQILRNKKWNNNGFFVPEDEDHAVSLLYHCIYHKGIVKDDYMSKIAVATTDPILKSLVKTKDLIALAQYLGKKGIKYKRPIDYTVYRLDSVNYILVKISRLHNLTKALKNNLGAIKNVPIIGSVFTTVYKRLVVYYLRMKNLS